MSWNQQPSVLPAGGAARQALVKTGPAATALAWAGRPNMLHTDSTDRTVANTTTESMVAESVLSFNGAPAAGDLVVIESWGEVLNNTGATQNVTPALRTGSTSGGFAASIDIFRPAAAMALPTAADTRKWMARVVLNVRDPAPVAIGAHFWVTTSTTAGVWAQLTTSQWQYQGARTLAIDFATQTQSVYLGGLFGAASANLSMTHRATRTLWVPA